MSMTPDIVKKILEGMRLNLKGVVLPQLKDSPYPTGQAVSIYVLLKALMGYASPEFQTHIRESSNEMTSVLREAKELLCDGVSHEEEEVRNLCQELAGQLEKKQSAEDAMSQYQALSGTLTSLIKVLWSGIEIKEEARKGLKEKTNACLRKQLDRELALFTESNWKKYSKNWKQKKIPL